MRGEAILAAGEHARADGTGPRVTALTASALRVVWATRSV
jgi:hypothetical protein